MFCPVCGNLLEDNTKFCGNCGTKIDNNMATASGDSDTLVNDFLKSMEGPKSTTIEEKTEAVFQNTKERLFLDDDDDYVMEDEEIVEKFFTNLETLEEDAPMDLTKDYNPQQSYTPQIAPVFEEIPESIEEPMSNPETVFNKEEDNFNKDGDDDYSNIIMGDASAFAPQPPLQQELQEIPKEAVVPTESAVSTNAFDTSAPNEVALTPPLQQPQNNTQDIAQQQNEEPQIFIDERPDFEQTSDTQQYTGYDININTDGPMSSQTPYLDSFLQRPSVNVDFEQPNATLENQSAGFNAPPQQTQPTPNNMQYNDTSAMPVNNGMAEQCQQPTGIPPMQQQIPPQIPQSEQLPPIPQQQFANMSEQATVTPKPKKKKTGLIVVLSIIGVCILGLIITGVIFGGQIIDSLKNTDIDIPNVPEITRPVEDENQEPSATEPSVPNDTTEPSTPDNTTEPENTTPPIVNNNPNWDITESSSIEDPLIAGKATNISRYLDDTKTYELLQMKVTNFYRGEEATRIANEYEEQTAIRFEKPQEGLAEYVVVEYQVYIPEDVNTTSTTANLPMEVRGKESTGVIFNNTPYVIFNWCIETGGTVGANNVVTCREIFQMPIGCTEYYLVFGTQGEAVAVYRGE